MPRTVIILDLLESASGLPVSVNWTFCSMLRLRRYGQISVENRRFRSNGGQLTQNFR